MEATRTPSSRLYPDLPSSTASAPVLTANQQHAQRLQNQAHSWESQGRWKEALDVWTDLVQFSIQNRDAMPRDKIDRILARAEGIKVRLEPSELLLNMPDGVTMVSDGQGEDIALAFTLKKVSQFVVMNCSNLVTMYIKDCFILKNDLGNNKFLYSIHNTVTKKDVNLELDGNKMGQEYVDSFDSIVTSQAVEFKDTSVTLSTGDTIQAMRPTVPTSTGLREEADSVIAGQDSTSNQTTADMIASGIATGTGYLTQGIDKLAKETKVGWNLYADHYVKTRQPSEKPMEISKTAKDTATATRVVSGWTAAGASKLADVVGSVAKGAATKIADSVSKRLPDSSDEKNGTESNMTKVVKVGGATIVAIGTIWNNLERNGREVGRDLREGTVTMVRHKHGDEAAAFTDDACRTAIDTTRTAFYINDIGIKAIAKKTVKSSGQKIAQQQALKHGVSTKVSESKK